MSAHRHVVDYVRLHARRRPDHPAVQGNGRVVSYAAFNRELRSMRAALRTFGLPAGSRVGISHSDLYVQALLVFAFESLGVACGSFGPGETESSHSLLRHCDTAFADREMPGAPCPRQHVITDDWLADARRHKADDDRPPRPHPDDGAAILRSSGTSGRPKAMLVTFGMMRWRVATRIRVLGLTQRSRFFSKMHFSVGSAYASASACFRLGATFTYDDRERLLASLTADQSTHTILLPVQVGWLLDELEKRDRPATAVLPALIIQTIGAKLVADMRRRALAMLCGRIVESYGSNESLLNARIDAQGIGTLEEGVQVQIVDGSDRVLPPGEPGQIRLRSPGVVGGYLGDLAASRAYFRDGWFYPGDLGMMDEARQFRLIGRNADVLNIGGVKIACADVESAIAQHTPVSDVAVLQIAAATRDAQVVVCIVLEATVDWTPFDGRIEVILERLLKTKHFILCKVDTIPRTAEGKIRRREVSAVVERIVGAQQKAPAPVHRHVLDYVRLHARRRPHHRALQGNGRVATYAMLHQDLRCLRAALRRFDLPPGSRVAVSHADLYVQTLVVFAFESLGVACGSFGPGESESSHSLLRHCDMAFADREMPGATCPRVHAITDEWLADALRSPADDAPVAQPHPNEVVQVLRSSGTSGRPKIMLVTFGMLRWRVATRIRVLGLTQRSRFFSRMHFSMGSVYASATTCLRLGATFMYDDRDHLLDAMVAYRPTHTILLPLQVGRMLDAAETPDGSGSLLLPDLVIQIVGAKLVPHMRRRAQATLCGRIIDMYGSNESFLVARIDADGIGILEDEVETEIVDGHDRAVPRGEPGQIRIRSPGVVRGYLGDASTNGQYFRDGWFYPGDLGVMEGARQLRLIGRNADVLNIGGLKLACADVESAIAHHTPVADVAVLQVEAAAREGELAVFVVLAPPVDWPSFHRDAYPERIRVIVRRMVKTEHFRLYRVDAIPRTAEGKIRRNLLADAIDRATAPTQTEPARIPA